MSSSKDTKASHSFLRDSSQKVRTVDFGSFQQESPAPSVSPREGTGLGESSSFVVAEDQEQQAQERVWKARIAAARHEGYVEAEEAYQSQLKAFQERFESQQFRTLSRLQTLEEAALHRVLWVAEALGRKYAQHLLERELETEEAMVAAVRGPLLRACGLSHIRLFVHPDAVEALQENLEEIVSRERDATTIEILPDPGLTPGDCRISSEQGQIESVLSERLDRLVELTSSRLEAYAQSQPPLLPPES